eukprot:5485576-Pyramimonas_sp.AAC.1
MASATKNAVTTSGPSRPGGAMKGGGGGKRGEGRERRRTQPENGTMKNTKNSNVPPESKGGQIEPKKR